MAGEDGTYRVYSFVGEWRRANPTDGRSNSVELDYENIFERVLREHLENHAGPYEKPIGIEVHPEVFAGFQRQCLNTYLMFHKENEEITPGVVQWHGLMISERQTARPFEVWLRIPNVAGPNTYRE